MPLYPFFDGEECRNARAGPHATGSSASGKEMPEEKTESSRLPDSVHLVLKLVAQDFHVVHDGEEFQFNLSFGRDFIHC